MTGNTQLSARRARTGATGRRCGSRCAAQGPESNVRKLKLLFCTTQHVCIYVSDAEHHSLQCGTRFGGRLQEGTLLFCSQLHIRHSDSGCVPGCTLIDAPWTCQGVIRDSEHIAYEDMCLSCKRFCRSLSTENLCTFSQSETSPKSRHNLG